MNQEIERIDLEIESIAILTKKLILEADINLGLLSELVQVMDKRISELMYVKDHIGRWDEPEDKILDLEITEYQQVFIRSKTDGEWISVKNIWLVEINQIFAIHPTDGQEYKLLSKTKGEVHFVTLEVEKVKG